MSNFSRGLHRSYYERYEQKNIQKDWFATYHTMMWMGSWETTSQVVKGALESMFGVTEGSMSYGVQGNGRVGRINLSDAADVSDSRRECLQQQPDRRRNGLSLTKSVWACFFPEDYHALKGSVTTKSDAIEMLRKVAHGRECI